jgi:hypothetical protein
MPICECGSIYAIDDTFGDVGMCVHCATLFGYQQGALCEDDVDVELDGGDEYERFGSDDGDAEELRT